MAGCLSDYLLSILQCFSDSYNIIIRHLCILHLCREKEIKSGWEMCVVIPLADHQSDVDGDVDRVRADVIELAAAFLNWNVAAAWFKDRLDRGDEMSSMNRGVSHAFPQGEPLFIACIRTIRNSCRSCGPNVFYWLPPLPCPLRKKDKYATDQKNKSSFKPKNSFDIST